MIRKIEDDEIPEAPVLECAASVSKHSYRKYIVLLMLQCTAADVVLLVLLALECAATVRCNTYHLL
jgi:hypothetical protein